MAAISGNVSAPGLRSGAIGPYTGTAAPVDGTSGTLAGVAAPGALYIRTATAIKLYINTNTKASPTWVVTGTQT